MVSDLERQRRENIERNQKALREFQLKEAAHLAFGDKEQKRSSSAQAKLGTSNSKKRRQKLEDATPPRRVRNLRKHGLSEEDKKKYFGSLDPSPEPVRDQKSLDQERKQGELKFQDLVEKGEWNQALDIMRESFGGKVSHGDLFQPDTNISDERLSHIRAQLSNELVADERDIKVVPERITSIAFHPSAEKRVVLAGDKVGELGVWDADRPEDEGLVNFKFHTRGIATILVDPDNTSRVYTASYDSSIRRLDLQEQKSSEAFVYTWDSNVGISDFSLVDTNTVYYSTLDGCFGIHDMRTKRPKNPLRLCDKKIGGFSVNPLNKSEVATASLDRSLKLWDLRKPYQLEIAEGEETKGAFLNGIYSSRLSISASSWNTSGQIVCNGYDNTINVFDLDKFNYGAKGNVDLEPSVRLQHNCQTGRWVSILKARWQERPRDGAQKFVIGNMKRFADIFAGSGQQLAHLDADHLTAVPAVAQFHRTENWVVGGNASGKVYLWSPASNVKEEVDAESGSEEAVEHESVSDNKRTIKKELEEHP